MAQLWAPKWLPSYANIFMGKFEKQLLEWSIERPLSWYRSIDDMDMRWTQSDEELQNFLSRHGRLRKDFGQFEFFFDGCPMPTNGVEAVSQTGMVCEDTRVLLHFRFSLF
jgi:hypothetical protein